MAEDKLGSEVFMQTNLGITTTSFHETRKLALGGREIECVQVQSFRRSHRTVAGCIGRENND